MVLPPAVAPFLGLIAQLGVILYMFLVGLELNAGLLKHRAHATVATSHASILVPFLLGTLLAFALYPRLSTAACRSPASRCSWEWPCRSLPFPCWRGF